MFFIELKKPIFFRNSVIFTACLNKMNGKTFIQQTETIFLLDNLIKKFGRSKVI